MLSWNLDAPLYIFTGCADRMFSEGLAVCEMNMVTYMTSNGGILIQDCTIIKMIA